LVAGFPTKFINSFIDSIPDEKLEGGIRNRGTIYKDRDMRLDCQETIDGENPEYDIRVQINKDCRHTSLAMAAPDSVAYCFAPVIQSWPASKIREELKKTVTGWPIPKVSRPKAEKAEKHKSKSSRKHR
jgi:hypothetical protein